MSKHMQLTVSVRPYYEKGIEAVYPNLAKLLGRLDMGWMQKNPSLYEIVERLDKILYKAEGTRLREVLLTRRDALLKLFQSIQANIADWRLAEADRLLYQMEDIFESIEADL